MASSGSSLSRSDPFHLCPRRHSRWTHTRAKARRHNREETGAAALGTKAGAEVEENAAQPAREHRSGAIAAADDGHRNRGRRPRVGAVVEDDWAPALGKGSSPGQGPRRRR
nr:unnamed protein product [Digitaria exilis]